MERVRGRLVPVVWLACAALVSVLVSGAFARFSIEGWGFTYVLDFGETIGLPRVERAQGLPIYVHEGVDGYDAQFYAQLALDPMLGDPRLEESIDSLQYRARRFLMGWSSWVIGGGDPWRVLNVFACFNLATWFGLGVVLLRWCSPSRPEDFLRWCGVMLSAGMLGSLRHALTDGPALLALAWAALLVEQRRPWLAALAGTLAPLTRETAVLGTVVLAPVDWRSVRAWLIAGARGAVMVVPLAAWIFYVHHQTGGGVSDGTGHRNLAPPFVGYAGRWVELVEAWSVAATPWVVAGVLGHVGVSVQALWVIARPRWTSVWWRIGAVHVVLLAILGQAVWEGYPGAAMRVLLPLTLAFNLLVPRGRVGLALLVVGNLSVLAGIREMAPPPRPIWAIVQDEPSQDARDWPVRVSFGRGFYAAETSGKDSWRWTADEAVARIENVRGASIPVALRLAVNARGPRSVEIVADGEVVWRGEVGTERSVVDTGPFRVPAGGTEVVVRSGAVDFAPGDTRPLGVRVFLLEVVVDPSP
jgi:hypothetical protein